MSTQPQNLEEGHGPPVYLGSNPISPSVDAITSEKDTQLHVNEVSPANSFPITGEIPKKSLKTRITFWLSFFAGILWLVPIIYLLYINFTEKTIGASAWCPGGNCSVISYELGSETETAYMKAVTLSEHDHNLLGVLQLVAKMLEIWFIAVAASLVYTLSRILATKPGGLPLGYLLAHVEFADMLNLTNSSLYKSVRRHQGSSAAGKSHRKMFILFVTLIVFLCILANFIGPMTAVLLMPSLEPDYQTTKIGNERFLQMRSSFTPSNGNNNIGRFINLDETELDTGNYTYFNKYYTSALDDIVHGTLAFLDQQLLAVEAYAIFPENYTPTLENNFPLSFNTSEAKGQKISSFSWATNRQVVRELSRDFNDFSQVTLGSSEDASYTIARNALSVTLQREAPIAGFTSYSSWGNVTIIEIDGSRMVRCISDYASGGIDNSWYSKCFRTGEGWNSTTNGTSFLVDPDKNDNITVFGYWYDRSAYYKGRRLRTWNECFQDMEETNITVTGPSDCNWESMFNQVPPEGIPPMGEDGFLFEYWNSDPYQPQVLVYEIHPLAGKANYSVDVTQVATEVSNVRVERLPQGNEIMPIVVNPGWLLATWGIDNLGYQSVTYSNRSSAGASAAGKLKLAVNDLIEAILATNDLSEATLTDELIDKFDYAYTKWIYITQNMALQMLSLITYDTTTEQFAEDQEERHPIMTRNMRLKIWKWGIGSRTSEMGVVIAIVACVVVLVRSVVLVLDREPKPSTIGIIASLMEHIHTGELQHVPQNRRQAAGMVRFRMPELMEDKLVFERGD